FRREVVEQYGIDYCLVQHLRPHRNKPVVVERPTAATGDVECEGTIGEPWFKLGRIRGRRDDTREVGDGTAPGVRLIADEHAIDIIGGKPSRIVKVHYRATPRCGIAAGDIGAKSTVEKGRRRQTQVGSLRFIG